MDVQTIIQIISTLGFPIACCIALFWYINKTLKDFTKDIQQAVDKLTDSISKDTDATTKLVTTVELLASITDKSDNG